MQADFPVILDACVLANVGVCDLYPGVVLTKVAEIATNHGEEIQDVLIHLGKSVPAFSRRLLEDSGKDSS